MTPLIEKPMISDMFDKLSITKDNVEDQLIINYNYTFAENSNYKIKVVKDKCYHVLDFINHNLPQECVNIIKNYIGNKILITINDKTHVNLDNNEIKNTTKSLLLKYIKYKDNKLQFIESYNNLCYRNNMMSYRL